jgi:hypothetical protein
MIAIAGSTWTDWASASGVVAGSPIETDALVSVCRVTRDSVELRRIGGTYIRVDPETIRRFNARAAVATGSGE